MKKLFNNKLFIFLLGGLLFGTTSAIAATLLADNISYDNTNSNLNANNVQDAIDSLNTKVNNLNTYDEYSGVTTYTPSSSTQTIYTNNKLLKNNITINPIPETYKQLITTTTVNPNNLLDGVKAYNNLGELVTGNILTNCVSGNVSCTSCTSSEGQKLADFKPSTFIVATTNSTSMTLYYYNEIISASELYCYAKYTTNSTPTYSIGATTKFIKNNKLILNNFTSGNIDKNIYYIACK